MKWTGRPYASCCDDGGTRRDGLCIRSFVKAQYIYNTLFLPTPRGLIGRNDRAKSNGKIGRFDRLFTTKVAMH